MLTNKAYKRMLTASVLTAVMGPGSVYAADVQAGYTPDMTTTTTTQTADVVDTAEKQAVYNATEGKVLDKKAQAEADAQARAEADSPSTRFGALPDERLRHFSRLLRGTADGTGPPDR